MAGEFEKIKKSIFVDVGSDGERKFIGERDGFVEIIKRDDFFDDGD